MMISKNSISEFLAVLAEFYGAHGRHTMAWRMPEHGGGYDPYKILVSEIMLQQTQVSRVEPKYGRFIDTFPTIRSLANAPQSQVLQMWNGLGYNRRAKYLWESAKFVIDDYAGVFPQTVAGLIRLPGVGPNTAGAIIAYAYDRPTVYIETNIKTVILHHFFANKTGIADVQITSVMTELISTISSQKNTVAASMTSPRHFYWGLMDYGSFLKTTVGNLNRATTSYSKQPKFNGSRRQLRGHIIRLLSARGHTHNEIASLLDDPRTANVIRDLTAENMIMSDSGMLKLA